jgi:hypothetical protein
MSFFRFIRRIFIIDRNIKTKMSVINDNEAYQHFKETLLTELTANLKPVISSLTMLADDYKQSSRDVVRAVEEYIDQVCKFSR